MNEDLHYDSTGLHLTATAEGVKLEAYPDPGTGGDPWTIGVGHTGPEVHPGITITYDQAMQYLAEDAHLAEEAVKKFVKVQLTQNQFDALVDFTFNCGAGNLQHSTLLRLLNNGLFKEASEHFLDWVKGGGHVLPGLVKRREAEESLFLQA